MFRERKPVDERVLQALTRMAAEGSVRLEIRGDSMKPMLEARQSVEVTTARHYWPGDVIAFSCPRGHLVVHRVLGYRPRWQGIDLVVRGDSAASADVPVPCSRVIGRVVGGDCPVQVYQVPWAHRLRAGFVFLKLVLQRCLR